jgi:tetratricopeptide (TPR) repeat protein
MLYLIVPPIVIVITLALLLWYLSKKASDPVVNERVMEMEELHKGTRFQGIREWRLRFLEKLAQRSKTSSLRMHNALHSWLQSIRASRKQVQEQKQLVEEYREKEESLYEGEEEQEEEIQYTKNEGVSEAKSEPKSEKSFAIPMMQRRRRGEEVSQTPPQPKITFARKEELERPMVSEKVALPDGRRVGRGKAPEEEMIERIANNPKDFEAYEALGDFYMDNGNIKDAKECYRQVLKLSPVQRMVKIKIRRLEKLLSQKGN